MPITFDRVRIGDVPHLRELVALARTTPTGAEVMGALDTRRTNYAIYTPDEWSALPHGSTTAATYEPSRNTIHFVAEGPLDDNARFLVHEGQHRLQQSRLFPRAAFQLDQYLVQPWRSVAAGSRAAAAAASTGQDPAAASRQGMRASVLAGEIDAYAVELRFHRELHLPARAAEIAERSTVPAARSKVMSSVVYEQLADGLIGMSARRVRLQGIVAATLGAAAVTAWLVSRD